MEIDPRVCEIFRHLLSQLWPGVEVTDEVLKWNIEMNLVAGMLLELDRHDLPEVEAELGDYVEALTTERKGTNSEAAEEAKED